MASKGKAKSRKPLVKGKRRRHPSASRKPARSRPSKPRRSKPSRRGSAARAKAPSKAKAAAKARAAIKAKAAAKAKAARKRQVEQARAERLRAAAKRTRERAAAQAKQKRERARKAHLRKKVEQERIARRKRERAEAAARKERARAQAKTRRERAELVAKKERERAQAKARRAREQLLAKKQRETTKKKRVQDLARAKKERARAEQQKARERQTERKAKDKQRARLAKEREAARVLQKKAREEARIRQKAEREAARTREKAEREAERERVREEARRRKEEERARRDAEREAYRKAKEAEQARLRAEREAAKRALEGRVVRATRASRAAAGGRLATTRVYTPSSIPDQSGTRRAIEGEAIDPRFANLRVPHVQPRDGGDSRPIPRTLPPPPAPPPPAAIEDRFLRINQRLALTDEGFRSEYQESLLMSWIYHDSALEGVVYTYEELRMAINPNIAVVPDSSLQTVCDEIRRHKAAIEFVKEQADRKRVPLNMDTVKRIFLILHPEEGDLKTVKYRKDIPQHRLYFHEYAPPDKIAYKVRQVFDWLNGPEPKKIKNPVRIAARVHYDLLRVFPFGLDSGKVVRLFMNLMLMRADCPPAIIHSTERQKYYEALRGQLPIIVSMVTEAITNALTSIEKKLDERDTKLRTFG